MDVQRKYSIETVQEFISDVKRQYKECAMHGNAQKYPGLLFMIGGLDFAGKGVGLNALQKYLTDRNLKVFDVVDYQKKHKSHPPQEEWESYDALMLEEPSWENVGLYVRDNLIAKRNAGKYDAITVAKGYANARLLQNNAVVKPALKLGKIVLEGRGLESSMAYQPTQDHFWRQIHDEPKIKLIDILRLEGNANALEMLPDALVIPTAPASQTMGRVEGREKKDDSYFETLSFQAVIEKLYGAEEFHQFFRNRGTNIKTFDASQSAEDTAAKTAASFEEFLREHKRAI